MHLQQELRRPFLFLADGLDAVTASLSRSRLHAQAAFARLVRGKPPIDWVAGPATPCDVVADHPLARLLHYQAVRPAGEGKEKAKFAPVLVVASLINKYYVLDLLPGISVIDTLRRRGFDVFVVDWKAPGGAGPDLTFADYVDGVIPWGAREAAARTGSEKAAVVGYCMGGTMAAMFAARHPALVSALVLLGTPIDFHASGVLAEWTQRDKFNVDMLMDTLGNMPPALMQSGFKLMNPLDAVLKVVRMHQEEDERTLRHMVALESWLEDNFAFPGGVYRDYIRSLYQDNALVRGAMKVGGTPVDLKALTAPVLNVIALRDHICEPPSSRVLTDLVGSTDKRNLEFDAGHVGITASRRAIEKLWPEIGAWLEERCR